MHLSFTYLNFINMSIVNVVLHEQKKKKDENSFNFSTKSSVEATKSSIEENKIIYDTIENLIIYKVVNDLIYIVIAESCHVVKVAASKRVRRYRSRSA